MSALNWSGTATVQAVSHSWQPVQVVSSTKRAFRLMVARNRPPSPGVIPSTSLYVRVVTLGWWIDAAIFGRRDAARAVQGGEDLAEQDHLAADAGFLLHQQDAVAHVAELQGGFHAADAGPHDQDVVAGHDRAADGPRSASAWPNCWTCRVNGSAHTEQMAAIFSRCGEWPACLEQRLRLADDPRRPRRAVREVGALVAVRGDEHAVEALLDGVEDPARAGSRSCRAG